MGFKKRPKELRKTIAEANSQETATVYNSLARERTGDGDLLSALTIKGTNITQQGKEEEEEEEQEEEENNENG